jgi:hypothetical protein
VAPGWLTAAPSRSESAYNSSHLRTTESLVARSERMSDSSSAPVIVAACSSKSAELYLWHDSPAVAPRLADARVGAVQ